MTTITHNDKILHLRCCSLPAGHGPDATARMRRHVCGPHTLSQEGQMYLSHLFLSLGELGRRHTGSFIAAAAAD